MTTTQKPGAGKARLKSPGATWLLFAAMAVFIVAMAAIASPAHADTLRVTTTRDDVPGSLRAAIDNAASSGDTVVFASNVTGTITLTEGDLNIDKNLTIRGPGSGRLAVSGNSKDRVFYIAGVKTVRISDLTITKGSTVQYGGGIQNYGNLTLTRSVVKDNYAGYGGGIYNEEKLTLIESVVSGNIANRDGGGINNYYGSTTVQRSTISGNEAQFGGGIDSETDLPGEGPLKTIITNSTISGNSISSASGEGGGIRNDDGLTEINNSTITNNAAPVGNGSGVFSNNQYSSANTVIFSSIIAGNARSAVDRGNYRANSFTSRGYNHIGAVGNAIDTFNKTGDQVGGDPRLGALANNGGLTRTHALQSGSPAIDAGTNTGCPAKDQRGASRPHGGKCDIGSFEFGATPPTDSGGGNGGGGKNTKPTITKPNPGPNSTTKSSKPLISAIVRDTETNLNKANIKMFVDGKRIGNFRYNVRTDRLTYRPKKPLSFRFHNVRITATDAAGLSAAKNWRFKVVKKKRR